jgi:diguanylate cyclase (GGDEF)-like protein
VARILLETGRPGEAAVLIKQAIEVAAPTDTDAIPSALLTLAEIQQRSGDAPAAVRTLEHCREITERENLPDSGAQALRMLADCHAVLGDFRAAYREMVDFHELWTVRRSEKSEVVARVTQARFAVDEARRTTEQFREMAERDALTGLWNRRRSDAELAALLAGRDRLGPASVAILDLDHFKQINDTYSHATGDEVLRRVAEVLRSAPGHAARHGGEEFILILPGEPGPAREACEQIRAALRAYEWGTIAAGLRVTISAGVTGLRPDDDALTVVRRADDLLYAAKHGGRDRVVAG